MKVEILIILTIVSLVVTEEGDLCTKNGKRGTCKIFHDCKPALDEFMKYRTNPQICSWEDDEPVVCCVKKNKYGGSRPWGSNSRPNTRLPECEPISRKLTAQRTGQKAWDKCLEYQEKLIFPCRESTTPSGGMVRLNLCNRKPEDLIIGGVNAYEGEFPHMVLLGFANGTSDESWACGGILVSERFILTAGHCTRSKEYGPLTDAKVGILKRSAATDSTRHYKIKRIIKHPDYKSPKKYNDIALLETDREIALDQYAVPACLHNGHSVNDTDATAIGWGTTAFRTNKISDVLQKVTLQKFSDQECYRSYAPGSPNMRNMKYGYNSTTQICYGDWHKAKDSCNGDSGGPVQVKHPEIYCMYSVLGITSWGKQCGYPGLPAIYTRIAAFVPWIESIVWP
ncbi:unnamed protein product [Parnassius apollo]|uniref:(apollo) hypothetical protein n=1 Tax=Parnassius apollo TaxID=110799 RepID=A0A8S3WF51_PARAO|nr:unnamed protein product [Parnassius apollo]